MSCQGMRGEGQAVEDLGFRDLKFSFDVILTEKTFEYFSCGFSFLSPLYFPSRYVMQKAFTSGVA
tara:strand:+ start:311 stop:505 length:195 start_codon:yes stop_codon:yes gene_type:complete